MKVRRPGPDLVSVPDTSRETTVSQRPFPMGISVFSTSVQNCSALFLITHENARQFNSHWIFLFFLGSLLTAQRQMLPPAKPQRTQRLRLLLACRIAALVFGQLGCLPDLLIARAGILRPLNHASRVLVAQVRKHFEIENLKRNHMACGGDERDQ